MKNNNSSEIKSFSQDWCFEAIGKNGGKIIGSRSTVDELVSEIENIANNSETVEIHIFKRNLNYNPMISTEQMMDFILKKIAPIPSRGEG